MSEPCDRLRDARAAAGFAGATEAARAFGWNENTYRSHENGERGLKPQVAAKYATAFRISLEWLLTGRGKPSAATTQDEDLALNIVRSMSPDQRDAWLKLGRVVVGDKESGDSQAHANTDSKPDKAAS